MRVVSAGPSSGVPCLFRTGNASLRSYIGKPRFASRLQWAKVRAWVLKLMTLVSCGRAWIEIAGTSPRYGFHNLSTCSSPQGRIW